MGANMRIHIISAFGKGLLAVGLSFLVHHELNGAPATVVSKNPKGGTASTPAPDKSEQGKTRMIMQTIFEPIAKVLPLSFNETEFTSSKNRKEITQRLKELSDHAHILEKHAAQRSRSFEFVAQSLGRDAKNLYRWYTKGQFDEARFTLHNMTENCISCHSSLPASQEFPPADKFFAAIKLKDLPPLEKAHIQVLSRQFDAALGTYESVLRSKDIHPLNLVVLGAFTDYLKLCIHVKSDLKRPQPLMQVIDQLIEYSAN